MGVFRFRTTSGWYVAHHHGHSAFRLLRIAYEIEREYVAVCDQMRKATLGQSEHLKLIGQGDHLTEEMFRISSASVMMFQAMMEALINDSLETEEKLSEVSRNGGFKNKWSESLRKLEQDVTSFTTYHDDIYSKFRIPLVHPAQVKTTSFDDLTFKALLDGYRNGWLAYGELGSGLGQPHDPDSWKIMCGIHKVPSDADDES